MNEARQAFYEDTAEKAKTAQSAHKFVSKPTERTAGEATSYVEANYKQLIPWKKLKTLPKGMQKEWLERHFEHWNVGPNAVAQALGIAGPTLSHLTSALGIKGRPHRDKEAKRAYLEAMGAAEPETQEEPQLHEAPKPTMRATRQHIVLEGVFDAQAIADALKYAWPDGAKVKIEILMKELEE